MNVSQQKAWTLIEILYCICIYLCLYASYTLTSQTPKIICSRQIKSALTLAQAVSSSKNTATNLHSTDWISLKMTNNNLETNINLYGNNKLSYKGFISNEIIKVRKNGFTHNNGSFHIPEQLYVNFALRVRPF